MGIDAGFSRTVGQGCVIVLRLLHWLKGRSKEDRNRPHIAIANCYPKNPEVGRFSRLHSSAHELRATGIRQHLPVSRGMGRNWAVCQRRVIFRPSAIRLSCMLVPANGKGP